MPTRLFQALIANITILYDCYDFGYVRLGIVEHVRFGNVEFSSVAYVRLGNVELFGSVVVCQLLSYC